MKTRTLPTASLTNPFGKRYVAIERTTIMSGRGGMPSLGYGARITDLVTGEELACTRASSDWMQAGKRLASRRGWDCFAILRDGVSFAGHVRIVRDDSNRRLTLLSMRGAVIARFDSETRSFRDHSYATEHDLEESIGALVGIVVLRIADVCYPLKPAAGIECTVSAVYVNGQPLQGVHGERCTYDAKTHRFVFSGSPTGVHTLDAGARITDAKRLLAHWKGYVQASLEAIAG